MSRITFTHINSVVQNNLSTNYSRLANLQEQLSSGKAITRPSDAPIETTNDLELRSNLDTMSQYGRNLQDGKSYLGVVDATLISSNNLYQAVRELAIQGDNSTNTAVERTYLAENGKQMLLQLVAISNSTYKGDYLFSGQQTDKPPFQVMTGAENIDNVNNTATNATDTFLTGVPSTMQIFDRNLTDSNTASGNPSVQKIIPGTLNVQGLVEGTDYDVDYNAGSVTFTTAAAVAQAGAGGIDLTYDWVRREESDLTGKVYRQMDDSVVSQINLTADDVFGKTTEIDSFEAVIELLQGLHTNKQTDISNSISNIDAVFQRTLSAEAIVGSKVNQVEASLDRMYSKVVETTRLQSNIEDLDFAKAISDFTLQEAVYNASLQSAGRVLQPTLSDFI